MGIGRVIGAAAPIAAGYFGGPALAGTFGATGGAIAAGALTGAGIAALSGQDVLTGGITGGLGGMSGGAMNAAAEATKAAEIAKLAKAGAPTGQINAFANQSISPFTPYGAGAGQTMNAGLTGLKSGAGDAFMSNEALAMNTGAGASGPQQLAQSIQTGQGPNMGFRSLTSDVAGGGGYQSLGDTFAQGLESGKAAFREPGTFLEKLGDGSKAMGAGKLGLTGLGVASSAGAFDQEPISIESRPEEKYDPNRRLNLSMDTGISKYLNRDTGLRLLAGGGYLETGGEVGDGMSDDIKAKIEGNQEARLSDGEFVIPADVVSHLGNGSSDAGAKKLYSMMDKVRMARTGNKKQGTEIKPERYMPA